MNIHLIGLFRKIQCRFNNFLTKSKIYPFLQIWRLTCKKILPTFSSSLLPDVTVTQKRKVVSDRLTTDLLWTPWSCRLSSRSRVGMRTRTANVPFRKSTYREPWIETAAKCQRQYREAAAGPNCLWGPRTYSPMETIRKHLKPHPTAPKWSGTGSN